MRFTLIDKIVELEPGKSITAVKNLSLAEEYLADHFPGFPVMPGVLMLEAIVQAGAWLVRRTSGFRHSVVLLKQARNVKFGSFVQPGTQVTIKVTVDEMTDEETRLRGQVVNSGTVIVSARVTLSHYNLADRSPDLAAADQSIVTYLKGLHNVLANHWPVGNQGPSARKGAGSAVEQAHVASR